MVSYFQLHDEILGS